MNFTIGTLNNGVPVNNLYTRLNTATTNNKFNTKETIPEVVDKFPRLVTNQAIMIPENPKPKINNNAFLKMRFIVDSLSGSAPAPVVVKRLFEKYKMPIMPTIKIQIIITAALKVFCLKNPPG